MNTVYVCDCCGLCCQQLLVEANVLDILREPRIASARPLGRHDPAMILDACWILAGPGMPCPFLSPEHRCQIYPTRPDLCVNFATGSTQCRKLREQHGLPALEAHPATDDVLGEILAALM